MRAIPTWYNDTLFESLLEARWAVFFDTAGIPWEYEYSGYKLGELGKTWYLPDFWLPEQRSWVEVKPHLEFSTQDTKKMTNFDRALWQSMSRTPLKPGTPMKWFYIFVGSPYFNGSRPTYKVLFVDWKDDEAPASERWIAEMDARWVHCPSVSD